jgi:hypothetical protein
MAWHRFVAFTPSDLPILKLRNAEQQKRQPVDKIYTFQNSLEELRNTPRDFIEG